MKKLLVLMLACVILVSSCGSTSSIPAGNINNYGYFLVDGNDIYYTQVVLTDFSYFGNIYKYNTSTKKEILVAETEVDYPNEMNAYMTLHNGELYFLPNFLNDSIKESAPNIYKVKPDGKNVVPTPLFDKEISCTFMQIEGGLIYYYDDVDDALYSIKPNGTNKKLICKAPMSSISISGGVAYFADYELLRSVSLKGGDPVDIYDFLEDDDDDDYFGLYLQHITADGNYIYYSDDDYSRIGRIKKDGTGNEILYEVGEKSPEYLNFFNVSGDMIYIVAENYGPNEDFAILAVSTKGGEAKVLVSDSENFGDILPVSIWGNTIYFCGMPIYETIMDSDYVWFTVLKGGGRPSAFKPFNVYDESYDEDEWDWDDDYDWDDWDDDDE